MRKILIFVLALALILPTAALAAPAEKEVITGRTEQERLTGIITPAPITTELLHNVTHELVLQGIVVIDGPQLVFTAMVNGQELNGVSVVKLADKTWGYSVTVDPSAWRGQTTISYSAKTIYANGKTAGQTHTTAAPQQQTVRVAYVADFAYNSFSWGVYDREHNTYPYSYNLVKVWDNSQRMSQPITGTVLGTGYLAIYGDDLTYDGDPVLLGTEIPPVNVRSFGVSEGQWTYNEESGKHTLQFWLTTTLSNGQYETTLVNLGGINPSATYTYTASDIRSPGYTQGFPFTAPAAPVPVTPVVSGIQVTNIFHEYAGGSSNVKAEYELHYKINGTPFSITNPKLKFTFNSGTGFVDQELSHDTIYNGQQVTIYYTLPYGKPN